LEEKMSKVIQVRSLTLGGTVFLEDGREMQLVVDQRGSLGVIPKTNEHHASVVDQHAPLTYDGPPSLSELGLDQV
jgi:hypothetical protein